MNHNLKQHAKNLRKNMTDAERCLWRHLRNRQLAGNKFRRQHIIGHFIVDFVCLEKKLIVEVDGGQHKLDADADAKRSSFLAGKGYTVIRFWNNQVLRETSAVLERIVSALNPSSP